MTASTLRRRAARDDRAVAGMAAASRPRRTTPQKRAYEILTNVLGTANEYATVQKASVRLSFEELRPTAALRRRLERLKQDITELDENLSVVQESSATLLVHYNISAEELSLPQMRMHAQHNMQAMVRGGDLLRATDFANALSISKQAVSKALRNKRVFTVEVDGEQYYPALYLDPQLDRRQLEQVTKALGDLPGPSKLQFFLRAKHSLGGITPLQALKQGRFEQVRASALGFAQR